MLGQNTKQKKCVHHWIIDSPEGPTSFGRCKLCGATAEFTNELQSVLEKRRDASEDDHEK
jgi:hypothetical protein